MIVGMKLAYRLVTPAVWMKEFMGGPICYPVSLTTAATKKVFRKNAIKDKVAELFPNIKVTLKNSDGLAMLWLDVNNKI
jgi:hypothetical protein